MSQSARIGDAIIDLYAAVDKGQQCLRDLTTKIHGSKEGSEVPAWFTDIVAAIETLADAAIRPGHFESVEEALHSRD